MNGPVISQDINPLMAAQRGPSVTPSPAVDAGIKALGQSLPNNPALLLDALRKQAVPPSWLLDPVASATASAVNPKSTALAQTLPGEAQTGADLKPVANSFSNVPLPEKLSKIQTVIGKDHMADFNKLINERCDSKEQRLAVIESLYELAVSKDINPELKNRKTQLIQSLIREAARPCQEKRQGEYASCVVASAVHRYALDNPQGYVQMVRDLAIDGQAFFADGQKMSLDMASLNMTKGRNLSEAIVQQSAMSHFGIKHNVGAYADQAELLLEATFDRAFTRKDFVTDSLHAELVDSKGVNMLSIKLGTGDMHNNHAFTHVGAVYNEKNEIVGHLLRNPWGQTNHNLPDDFKLSDKEASVFFISKEDFEKRFNYAIVPGGERGVTPGAREVERGVTVFGDPLVAKTAEEPVVIKRSGLDIEIDRSDTKPGTTRGSLESSILRVRRDDKITTPEEPEFSGGPNTSGPKEDGPAGFFASAPG